MKRVHKASDNASAALERIASAISGDVHSDRLHRALYASDASIYQLVPDGVVMPRCAEDIQTTVRICYEAGVSITARGAGTGLTGGAVNRGIQLDCSRYLNRVLVLDAQQRTVTVEPGIVLDELNAQLKPHGLHFAPDVATSSRATIGGMIANNSCGAHSVIFGRTVDHLLDVDVVLSDGSRHTWGQGAPPGDNPLALACERVLRDVLRENTDEIKARFPTVMRRNGGYALDRLCIADGRINPETIVCGSEGTLAIVAGATLKLTPLPAVRGLVVVHFADLFEALGATPRMLESKPAAVELVDRLILDATKNNAAMARRRSFFQGDPAALLIVEFFEESHEALRETLQSFSDALRREGVGYAHVVLTDPENQSDVWEIRKGGLGLLMSKPGQAQPYAFVEDTAVEPVRLRDYIERFYAILNDEGLQQAGCYAHASVGCLHMRPILSLRQADDVARMRRIADRISSLALEYGGTMTGEHGDGLVRSEWLTKMYGPRIIAAFETIKKTFDPAGILNPGKIVHPHAMDINLRQGAGFATTSPLTVLDFTDHGGMAELANMCSGVGQCRQRLVGTMCPSYMGTGDERHTTRARANALRLAMSNRALLDGLDDPALDEVMDLCLMCKACKTECPTATDMAKLKAEWLAHRIRTQGASKSTRLLARMPELAEKASRFAPVSNWIMQSEWVRRFMEKRYGLDHRIPPPHFVSRTFRKWFQRHRKSRALDVDGTKPRVAFFADTWTNFVTPQVGVAAVCVLEALGFHVLVPSTQCCGRPLISKGLLAEARLLAEHNIEVLTHFADLDIPIVGVEPSCILTFVDEAPQFVRNSDAQRIARNCMTVETLLARVLQDRPDAMRQCNPLPPILYHGHCYQKAMIGTGDAMEVLKACTAGCATEINSGCCGMAGSFGHEAAHYEVSRAIGEQRLFPAVRNRADAAIAISGFSCRHQIHHHTDAQPRHLIEYVADAILPAP